jgi:hypothetical protein
MKTVPSYSVAPPERSEPKFSLLFFFLLAYLVLYPYAQHTGLPYLAFRIFGSAVTVLSVYAVSFRRGFVVTALLLAGPVFVQRVLLPRTNASFVSVAGIGVTLVFDVFIVVVIFRRVFINEQPTAQAIFGALCIYLLMGFSFANFYAVVAGLQPGAFHLDATVNSHTVPDRFDLIYYSFASLTCLGASGIVPVSDQARSISLLEAVLGILYMAVLISRLVSAYHLTRGSGTKKEK